MRRLAAIAGKVTTVRPMPRSPVGRSCGAAAGRPSGPPDGAIADDRSGRNRVATLRRAVLSASLTLTLALHAAAAELVMVEEPGCPWCARWDAEIAPAYPNTPEGRRAPLRRIGLNAPRPDDLTFDAPLRVTPTFVLVDDGREVARLEGYPGADFFWPLLEDMLEKLPEEPSE